MAKDKKIKMTEGKRICSVGGQALMEGIMMLAPNGMAEVVRNPKGDLVVKTEKIELLTRKYTVLGWPIIRGGVALISSMVRGMKALFYSADIAMEEESEDGKTSAPGEKAMGVMMFFSLLIALAFSVGLFFLLPNFLSSLIIPKTAPKVLYNLFEGGIRIILFFGYMILVTLMKDIKRVYMYHGAEHKTIHCFEHEDELTVENVHKYSKHHPRCGTAFLFVVMVISIIVYSLLPRFGNVFANMGLRVLALPIVAGIAYEFNRIASLHNNIITKILRAPGMAMQRFTTKEPDDDMIEVAIVALKKALEFEGENEVPCCEYVIKAHPEEDSCIENDDNGNTEEHDDTSSEISTDSNN